ncbi:MAG: CBS domain-containing protein [Exilibacterium sp.]
MQALTAKDIMKTEVLFAYEGWSIKYLADFLIKNKIAGVPVITADSELIGVASVTDIFRFENQEIDAKVNALRDYYQDAYGNEIDFLDLDKWAYNAEENCTTGQIMQRNIISVTEDTRVASICRIMLENKIHRVFVTKENKVTGVITTSNILALISEKL